MRKMISIMIVGSLSVLLAGCGSADKNPTEGNTASDNVQTQTPAADNDIQEDTQTAMPSADSQQGDTRGQDDKVGNNTTGNDTTGNNTTKNDTVQGSTGQGDTKTQNNAKKETSSVQGDSNTKGTQLISKDKAKQTAIKDAGVSDKDVSQLSVHLETDDGVRQYEVEFHAGKHEYEYEIDAKTGAIRSKDVDDKDIVRDKSNGSTSISKERAIKIALKKVPGATKKHVRIKLDRDNGRKVYEGSIIYKKAKYEFEIDASNGNLLDWDKESIYN